MGACAGTALALSAWPGNMLLVRCIGAAVRCVWCGSLRSMITSFTLVLAAEYKYQWYAAQLSH